MTPGPPGGEPAPAGNGASATAAAPPALPAPEFSILGVESIPHSAAPNLVFTGHLSETSGREVYAVALTTQVMIDPARRTYDPATRERLVELFGEPERWGATTHSFLWAELSVLVSSFTGATTFRLPMQCNYDLEIAATKYLHSVPGGEVPLSFHFTGTIFYRGEADRLQIVKVPWDCTVRFGMPASVWRQMIEEHYPNGGWVRLADETLERLGRHKAEAGHPTFDATVADLLGRD
jgi:hypothetical protein